MYRRININNHAVEKWLLQLFLADLIDYGNALPRKLQSPENVQMYKIQENLKKRIMKKIQKL